MTLIGKPPINNCLRKKENLIAYLIGRFLEKSPSKVIIIANGVGYELQVSLNTYSEISNAEEGNLYVFHHIYEGGQTMFGFSSKAEKEMFLHLISVSGIGASTARLMLSGMKPDEIAKAIVSNDAKQLEAIKGIGKKSAERLILDLKDKLSKDGGNSFSGGVSPENKNLVSNDALFALVALGISKNMAEQAISKTLKTSPNIALEDLIKQALKNI